MRKKNIVVVHIGSCHNPIVCLLLMYLFISVFLLYVVNNTAVVVVKNDNAPFFFSLTMDKCI